MENLNPAVALPTTQTCNSCSNTVSDDTAFCTNCGYPVKGTPEEQSAFELKQSYNHIDLQEYGKVLRSAGNSLYYLGGIFVFWGIVMFFVKQNDPEVLALTLPNLILGILFIALGGFSRKKPFASLVSGLALYIIVQVLAAIDNPANLLSGIIFKILIIGYLIKGIRGALNVERIKKENNIA